MTTPSTRTETAAAKARPQAADVAGAALWMCGALASFTLVAIAGREASATVSTVTILFYRSWFALAIILVVVAVSGRGLRQFRTPQFGMHCLRSVIHFGAQYSWLYALALISLAELFAIEFTAPLWTALMAPLLLRERLTVSRLAAVLLGFVGLLVVVRPGGTAVSTGTVFALLAALGFAAHYIITKRLLRLDSVFTVIFYMTVLQSILATVLALPSLHLPDATTLAWLFALATCGLTAHFSVAKAFALADVTIVAPMDFLRLPLIAVVGALLYLEPLNPWVLIGGGIVVLANLINIWGERRSG
jgi:drug/metabolite transporter (DMT)-like permease